MTGAIASRTVLALGLLAGGTAVAGCQQEGPEEFGSGEEIRLPPPDTTGTVPLERTIHDRRSIRDFRADSLPLSAVAQLLWSAQGITDDAGFRAAPSAGATYPLEVVLVAGSVGSLQAGVYRYAPAEHVLTRIRSGDLRRDVARAALNQRWIADAPATIAVAAVFRRTTARYGARGHQYVHMEVGHAAQNVYLQAGALGLGTTLVGAFDDGEMASVLELADHEHPLGVLPVGVPR